MGSLRKHRRSGNSQTDVLGQCASAPRDGFSEVIPTEDEEHPLPTVEIPRAGVDPVLDKVAMTVAGADRSEGSEDDSRAQPGRRGYHAEIGAVARVRPVLRAAGEPGTHRVQMDVATGLQEMPIGLNDDGLVASPEQWAVRAVTAVESLGIDVVQVPHRAAEVRLGGAHEQVVVVVHQAVCVKLDQKPRRQLAQQCKKLDGVVGRLEHGPLGRSTVHDVIPSSGELETQRSCHRARRRKEAGDASRIVEP